jgi:hypothetical protein
MSKKTFIFFVVVFSVILISIIYTYYDTMILKRFDIFISEDDIPTYQGVLGDFYNLIYFYVQ